MDFLNCDVRDIWEQVMSLCGGCPVHSRMYSSICDLSLLDDSNTRVKTITVSKHCQTYPGGQKSPLLEKHGSMGMYPRDPCWQPQGLKPCSQAATTAPSDQSKWTEQES